MVGGKKPSSLARGKEKRETKNLLAPSVRRPRPCSPEEEQHQQVLMGVLGEGSAWCFCSGGGKLERIKSTLLAAKGAAIAAISLPGGGGGSGFLIHRSLLLTTHATIPSAAAAGVAEVWLSIGRLPARLVPQRFFITSPILDLTIVGLDILDDDSNSHGQQPQFLKTCFNPRLDLGSTILLLGHPNQRNLTVGEGKVVIATDNLIKLSTDGVTWHPGSPGFDMHGNLAFMVCDPMKLAPSTPTGYASASSAALASRKDVPTQFAIPIPVVCEWLKQHWSGSLDDVSKIKLPPARLVTTGQASEHSSFSHLQSIRTRDQESASELSSSQAAPRPIWQHGSCSMSNAKNFYDENDSIARRSSHDQGHPTSQIRKPKNEPSVALLDINFPPRPPSSIFLPLPLKQMMSDENNFEVARLRNQSGQTTSALCEMQQANPPNNYEVVHSAAYQDNCCSEVQSSSSPLEVSDLVDERDGFSSGEDTMYSAETRESRNIPSPKEKRLETVGRAQGYANRSRLDSPRSFESSKGVSSKQHSFIPLRKPHLQAAAISQKSNDYFSPTVSSNMKKKNLSQIPMKPRLSSQVSSKWIT